MKKIVAAIALSLSFICSAQAGTIENIYANMDADMMASNTNVYNYYSPDAVIVEADKGGYYTVDQMRQNMQQMIRSGTKVEVYQSQIGGTREVHTGFTGKLCAVVVFSKDYIKMTGDDPKHLGQKITIEQSRMTTRVFNTIDPNHWTIISEHSSMIPSEVKVNGKAPRQQ